MKPELILQADILDIIFEDRNKDYGAYNLRKDYDKRMKKAIYGVLVLVSILFIFSYLHISGTKNSGVPAPIPSDIILDPFEPKPDLPKPEQLPVIKPATVKHVTPVIVNDDIIEPLPDIAQLSKDVVIGTETVEGPPAFTAPGPVESPTGNSPNNIPVEVSKEDNKIFEHPDFMPEFPGGQAAFIRFLSKNLRVPENALQAGEKIKILVRFVVGIEGELSNIEFIEKNGEVFEQEILRVMKKMPKWKPGRQNGENVKVYFKLPIIFNVPENE